MALSKKKLKFLQRHAVRKSPAELARELNVPLKEVMAHLGSLPDKAAESNTAAHNSDKYLVRVLGGIIFLAPFIILQELYDFSDTPKKAFIQLASLILFGLWLHNLSRSTVVEIRKCFLYLPLGIFLLWALISNSWASDHYRAYTIAIHWAACGLVFFLATQILDSARKQNLILRIIFITAILVALLGLAQQIFGVEWVRQIAIPASTFANRNAASQYVVLTFPLGLILLSTARRRVLIWAIALSLAIIASYLFHTFTRAGWLAVSGQITLFLIYLGYCRFRLKQALYCGGQKLAAVGAAFLVFVLLANLSEEGLGWGNRGAFARLSSLWKNDAKEMQSAKEKSPYKRYRLNSVSTRKTLYRNTLEIIREYPWKGVGLNNFVVYYPKSTLTGWPDREIKINKQQANTHNDYLQITSELGIPAVAALLCFLAALAGRLPVFFSRRLSQEERDTGCAFLIGILGLCSNAVVSFPLYLAMPPFMLGIYTAIFFLITDKREDGKNAKWVFSNGKMAFLGVILTAMILCFWIYWQYRFLRSEFNYNLQSIGLRDRYYKASVHWGLKAHEMNPWRKDVHNYLARALLKMEDRERAIEHFKRFHESYPDATYNLYYMALCYKELNQFEKARPLVERAIEILPDDGRLRDLMGWVYSSLKQPEKSIEEFRLAANLMPKKSNYHYNQGVTAFLMGKYEEAAEALGKSVELKSDYFLARKFLGLTLVSHLGRTEEGLVHLKKALSLKPTGKDAKMLRKLLEKFDQPEPSNL